VIPTSPASAGQGVKNEPEPTGGSAILGSGVVISRRFFVNKLVSLPVVAALPTAAPAMLAPETPQADDSKLLALADEYIVAERRYGDLAMALDHMNEHVNPPEVLRVWPRDFELGRKLTFDEGDEFWHRPCDITQWRSLIEYKTEWKETDDRAEMVQWKIKPSEELRLRGAEIVAAFDAWWHRKKPRGYKKAERERRRAERAVFQLEEQICSMPATTIEGMQAKIRCAEAWERDKLESLTNGCSEAMALSIFRDIRRMAGRPLPDRPSLSGARRFRLAGFP
jgi:hypothetical protein